MENCPAILIIDDSQHFLSLLSSHLKRDGYRRILVAKSGDQALALLDDEKGRGIDLVLLDILMPGMDGIELCRLLKSRPQLRDTPVIMVTGVAETASLARAFAAGAMDYIVKPVKPVELLARVRSALRLKAEMDRRKERETELIEVKRQLERANHELQGLTHTDSLTGVGNRRYFDELVSNEWGRAKRKTLPLSLIMIDLDDFKAFNDAYGHQRGDECLQQVAQALNLVIKRSGDFVVRYGGEEFAVVLPNTDLVGAMMVAAELREAVAALNIKHDAARTGRLLTLSMGVAAMVPPKKAKMYDLIAAADEALYRAKHSGRDQIVAATLPMADGEMAAPSAEN